MRSKQKVFGIGFHKTATSSLAAALYILGYNVTGYFGAHDPEIGKHVYDKAYDLADRFDAAQDTPWPVLYKELDKRYPDSKFILTVRPTDKWIKSVIKHFKSQYIPSHAWIYGVRTARGNEAVYIRRYEEHNKEVQEYFKQRPNDLLVMDITKGDGWDLLCPFLSVEQPPFDFPNQNTRDERSRQILSRGFAFLGRTLSLNRDPTEGSQMKQGVSATFVRDILHYHHSASELVWTGINQLTDDQFEQNHQQEGSIRDQVMNLISEETVWQGRLKGETGSGEKASTLSGYQAKDDLFQLWKNNQLWLREYASNLSDKDCNSRVPGRNEYIWEVIVHLMNNGTEKNARICQMLREFGVEVEEQTFITFFRDCQ